MAARSPRRGTGSASGAGSGRPAPAPVGRSACGSVPSGWSSLRASGRSGAGACCAGLSAVAVRVTGLPRDRISIEYGSTAEAPFDSGVFGSRTLGALGRAIEEAVVRLRRTLAERLGARGQAELSVERGEIVAEDRGAARGRHGAPDRGGTGRREEWSPTVGTSLRGARSTSVGSWPGRSTRTPTSRGRAHVAEVAVDRGDRCGPRRSGMPPSRTRATVVDPGAAQAPGRGRGGDGPRHRVDRGSDLVRRGTARERRASSTTGSRRSGRSRRSQVEFIEGFARGRPVRGQGTRRAPDHPGTRGGRPRHPGRRAGRT